MVLRHVLFGTLAFALTFAETIVSTWEGRADRQVRPNGRDNRFSKKAAHWAAVFETLLLVDVVLVVQEPVLYAPPIIAAAWLGKYWSLEKRRSMKPRVRRKRASSSPDDDRSPEGQTAVPSEGAPACPA